MNIDNFKVFCINAIFIIGIFGRLLSNMSLKGVDNTLKFRYLWKILEQV